jgi:hypothetical protein
MGFLSLGEGLEEDGRAIIVGDGDALEKLKDGVKVMTLNVFFKTRAQTPALTP